VILLNFYEIIRGIPDKNRKKKREGASGGTVGSLELYKYYVIISGTPKKSEKEMGSLFKIGHFKNVHFFKCDY